MEITNILNKEDIEYYLKEFRERWINITKDLQSAKEFTVDEYNWIYNTLVIESNFINGIIGLNQINFDKNYNNILLKKSMIDFELISCMKRAYILADKKKPFFFYNNIKKIDLPNGLGSVEFSEKRRY